ILHFSEKHHETTVAEAISYAAASIANSLKVKAIVCYTATGTTGLAVARQRPQQPILVLTPVEKTARRLNLVWGLHCVQTQDPANTTQMVRFAEKIAKDRGYGQDGDRMLVCAGVPFGLSGTTNMVRVFTLGEN